MDVSDDIQHDMLLLALGNELHTSSPIPETATVLDVGTGTGTWACHLALRKPEARVYGIDLRQVSPKHIPHNVVFESVDVMTGFPFNTGTFDFVHSRLLIGGITDWPSYLQNLCRITKRGGTAECIEMEMCTHTSGKVKKSLDGWTSRMISILHKAGLDPDAAVRLKERMQTAGFANVQEHVLEIPIGTWPEDEAQRRIGALALRFHEQNVATWVSQSMIDSNQMTLEEAAKAARAVLTELQDPENKAHWRWHFCSAQKGD